MNGKHAGVSREEPPRDAVEDDYQELRGFGFECQESIDSSAWIYSRLTLGQMKAARVLVLLTAQDYVSYSMEE